jgi:hypothetical protein
MAGANDSLLEVDSPRRALISTGTRAAGPYRPAPTTPPNAATHARILCLWPQIVAAAYAAAIALVALVLCDALQAPWCHNAHVRYQVLCAVALAVDACALQPLWVGCVALRRWLLASEIPVAAASAKMPAAIGDKREGDGDAVTPKIVVHSHPGPHVPPHRTDPPDLSSAKNHGVKVRLLHAPYPVHDSWRL